MAPKSTGLETGTQARAPMRTRFVKVCVGWPRLLRRLLWLLLRLLCRLLLLLWLIRRKYLG